MAWLGPLLQRLSGYSHSVRGLQSSQGLTGAGSPASKPRGGARIQFLMIPGLSDSASTLFGCWLEASVPSHMSL